MKEGWKDVKRAAIYAIYDKEGIVEPYVVQIMEQIRPYVMKLVVVCNGILTEEGRQALEGTADEIIVRDNIGYDAGAYKDAILWMNGQNWLQIYDELILMNDSFFGFFYSLDDFFQVVYQGKGIDFWGFTKHPQGGNAYRGRFDEHIQTYFLLVNKSMLHSGAFLEFWKELSYPGSYQDAIWDFEIKFTGWFERRGFHGAAYCDLRKNGIEVGFDINPYTNYAYELITKSGCPILKRKSVWIESKESINALKALEYLENNRLLKIDSVWEYLIRKCRNGSITPYFDFYRLECFCRQYSDLYIYGAGKYGRRMKAYLDMRGFPFKKFIVTHKGAAEGTEIIEQNDLRVESNTGIILALNAEHTKQVWNDVLAIVDKEQIFCGGC